MEVNPRVAALALTARGGRLARRIAGALGDAEVHGLRGRVSEADRFFADTARHLQALFEAGRPIAGVCAAGILVRALAPALGDKRAEPPVVALSEDGAFAVPLLGAHRGGVDLARRIAAAVGAEVAVTSAGDRRFGVALDAPPEGWTLANPDDYKPFAAALLHGARVRVPDGVPWLAQSDLPRDDAGELAIRVDDRKVAGSPRTLVYRPRRLALGIGCERGVSSEEIEELARSCLDGAGLAPESVAAVFSIDLKADEPGVHALAASLGVPARFFAATALEAEADRLRNPSELVVSRGRLPRRGGGRGPRRGGSRRRAGRCEDEVRARDLCDRAGAGAARSRHPRRGARRAVGGRRRAGRCRHPDPGPRAPPSRARTTS